MFATSSMRVGERKVLAEVLDRCDVSIERLHNAADKKRTREREYYLGMFAAYKMMKAFALQRMSEAGGAT